MEDDELIQNIEKLYFDEVDKFNLDHLLNELPNDLTCNYLEDHKNRLEKLLTVVTRKVSQLILSHQPTYVDELERIAQLQKSINDSIRVCSQGRSCLNYVKDGAAKNGKTIVEHYRKRESLSKLLDSMTLISDLKKSIYEIRMMIENQEDFPKAIQMCKDGKQMLTSFDCFKCVTELGSKLNDDMKRKLSLLICNHDFSCQKFDEFNKILSVIDLMTKIGNEFSSDLVDFINSQALNFFNSYHKYSMDELRMFLENELWEVVPVRGDFKLVQLKEFSFLRPTTSVHQPATTVESTSLELAPVFDTISLSIDSDDDLDTELSKESMGEEDLSSSDDAEEHHQATTEPSNLDNTSTNNDQMNRFRLTRTSGPILTNSSLNVLRLIGKYIQMMSVLKPISYDILMRIYSLLDYYTVAVFKKFGQENDKKSDDKNISPKLKAVIRSIRESLIRPTEGDFITHHDGTSCESNISMQQGVSDISSRISTHLNTATDQPASPKKAVAVESLIFLINQLWNLQEYLESLIAVNMRARLREQFSQNHCTNVPDFLKVRAEMKPSGMLLND